MPKANVYETSGDLIDDRLGDPNLATETSLVSYVLHKMQEWEDFVEANYYSNWDEYYRIWRGEWAREDQTRSSERSRIVTPASQQAVESSTADIEEATFGHGELFDIRDDSQDSERQDIAFLRTKLDEDFRKQRIRQSCAEVLLNAAVYGTGLAEVVLEEQKDMAPATEPIMDGQMQAVGVNITDRVVVKMNPIQPKNFRIDPLATCIEEAHGCGTDEFVSAHLVQDLQARGIYRPGFVGQAAQDNDLEPDPTLDVVPYSDKVQLKKYFGLVPRHLLEQVDAEEEVEVPDAEDYWVEAIVVIGNDSVLLKADANPYMMQDRPIVAFQWDIIPGLFWGRGVVEKGYNPQKALDAEIRARIDALALTIHPILAMDSTRIPRGHTPQIRPGKMLLTNGSPRDVLMPFNFGDVSQITFAQAQELQNMVQQATGAVDVQDVGSNNKTGAVSMTLGSIVKRQKRTLLNFQECFWIPFVEKAAWRYMQFDPENYPVQDYKFIPTSTLGIMAREYEVSQLVQLLQTMSPESPMYPALVKSIVENMNLNNREQLVQILDEAAKPNPEMQQRAQEAHQLQMALQRAQVEAVDAQANESNARAQNYTVEAQLQPQELEIKRIDAVTKNLQPGATEDQEFVRRLRIAETKLKEKEVNLKEADMRFRQQEAQRDKETEAELMRQLGT
jgi:uncharacterized membrane protein